MLIARIIILWVCMLCMHLNLNAQIDTVSSGNTVIIYKNIDYEIRKKGNYDKNVIKVGMLDLVYGYQAIYYERLLNDYFSIEAGAGVGIRNFYEDAINKLRGTPKIVSDEISGFDADELSYYGDRRMRPGFTFNFSPRFYTRGWGIDGFYIGADFRYLHNRYVFNIIDAPARRVSYDEQVKKQTLHLLLGTQIDNRPVSIDFGVGLGYKHLSSSRYMESALPPDNNTGDIYMPAGLYNYKNSGFSFLLYLKVGGFLGNRKSR